MTPGGADGLTDLWDRALRPEPGFRARAAQAPGLGAALGSLLAWRTPLALLGNFLAWQGFAHLYGRLCAPESPVWQEVLQRFPDTVDPEALRAALAGLPALPSLAQAAPWLVLAAPLGVLGLWLHDACMDHTALWLLGGLKARRGFRATLTAEAEALKVGALGAAVALLAELPRAGLGLALVALAAAAWFWVLRGFALAAWHGLPAWKGVAATLLHLVLLALMAILTLGLTLVLVLLMQGGGSAGL